MNKVLNSLVDEGIKRNEKTPFYKRKVFWGATLIGLTVVGTSLYEMKLNVDPSYQFQNVIGPIIKDEEGNEFHTGQFKVKRHIVPKKYSFDLVENSGCYEMLSVKEQEPNMRKLNTLVDKVFNNSKIQLGSRHDIYNLMRYLNRDKLKNGKDRFSAQESYIIPVEVTEYDICPQNFLERDSNRYQRVETVSLGLPNLE